MISSSFFPFRLVSEAQDPAAKFCLSALRVCVATCVCACHMQPPRPFIMMLSVTSLLSWKFLGFGMDRRGSTDETRPFSLPPAHTFNNLHDVERKDDVGVCVHEFGSFCVCMCLYD